MDKYKFGEFIYQKRKSLGLTQEELGRKLGVTNKAVSKWEVGETLPDVTMLIPLSDALHISVDELLSQRHFKEEDTKRVQLNKLLLILVFFLVFVEIITIASFVIVNNYNDNKNRTLNLTSENCEDVIYIIPLKDFSCDGQTININSSYVINNNYEVLEEVKLKIVYNIKYYYYTNDNNYGVISYYNRENEVVFQNTNVQSSETTLTPLTEIVDFRGIKDVEMNYQIIECSGVLYKK